MGESQIFCDLLHFSQQRLGRTPWGARGASPGLTVAGAGGVLGTSVSSEETFGVMASPCVLVITPLFSCLLSFTLGSFLGGRWLFVRSVFLMLMSKPT